MNELSEIYRIIISLRQSSLQQIITKTEQSNVLHGQGNLLERLDSVKRDYNLMCQFMLSGAQDPQREFFYNKLKQKMFSILADARMAKITETNNTLKKAKTNAPELATLLASMQSRLEGFEGDLAMAELVDDANRNKQKAVFSKQHSYRQQYFNAIITSNQISEAEQTAFTNILLSPTVERTDQDILISALLLSLQTQYDNNKFLALLRAFRDCKDEYLHAHLLVALVLALHDNSLSLYKDTDKETLIVLSEDSVKQELLQLQMQMYLCTSVDEVDNTLKTDIIPTIMKHQNPRDILKDDTIEGSSLDEILKPNTSEESIDELEQTIARMDNMQKKGMDIYFGGFSKMKRDSFFYTLVNWFYPFTVDHPQLSQLPDEVLRGNMMKMLVEGSPLCDSDMYSMALGVNQVYNMLPQKFKDMFGNNELKIRESFDKNTPAYYRRTYLQNLVRFYRLYTSKRDFTNPFLKGIDDTDELNDGNWFFINNALFIDSGLFIDEIIQFDKYLFKRGEYPESFTLARNLLGKNTTKEQDTFLTLINGLSNYEMGYLVDAKEYLEQVVENEPNNFLALKYLVTIALSENDFEGAYDFAQRLAELKPDDVTFQNYFLIAQIGVGKIEEASKELFRLYYEQPENHDIQKTVAWAYLHMKKPEKAVEIYEGLLTTDEVGITTYVNALCAYAFSGDMKKATEMVPHISKLLEERSNYYSTSQILDLIMRDPRLVSIYGFTRTDFEVLLDCA